MSEIKEQIEELKERLENTEAMLNMKQISDAIHIQALRDLIPEYIEELNSILKKIQ